MSRSDGDIVNLPGARCERIIKEGKSGQGAHGADPEEIMNVSTDAAQAVVAGVFGSYEQAEAAIADFKELGLTNCDIMFVARAGPLLDQARQIMERRGGRGLSGQFEEPIPTVAIPGD
jgi:hypothetical protein